MELTPIEYQLWDKFGEELWNELQKQINNTTRETEVWIIESKIDTTVDLFAYIYSNQLYNGISSNRAKEIINGVAYLMRKKLKEKLYE